MVLATHDVNAVTAMADRVYVLLRGGEIVAQGPPADIFRDPGLLRRSNIEPPVLAELFKRLEELGIPLGRPDNIDAAARTLAARLLPGGAPAPPVRESGAARRAPEAPRPDPGDLFAPARPEDS
jgi:hypothetical protein